MTLYTRVDGDDPFPYSADPVRGKAQDYTKGEHGYFTGSKPGGRLAADYANVDLSRMDPALVAQITPELEALARAYPDIARQTSLEVGPLRTRGDDVVAETDGSTITFSENLWTSASKLDAHFAEAAQHGRQVSPTPVGAAVHEFGHVLLNTAPDGTFKAMSMTPYSSDAPASPYARTNVQERFAETFTAIWLHDPIASTFVSPTWESQVVDDLKDYAAKQPVRGKAQDYTKGEHGYFTGSRPGGPHLIPPIAAGDQVPATGRQDILTDDPTRFENLPPELQAKLLAQLQKQFPGMTPEQLQANLETQLKLALQDPLNNGMTWYNEAGASAAAAAAAYGFSLEASVGALAALSPQQVWGSNLAGAQFAAQMIRENGFVDRSLIGDHLFAEAMQQLADRGLTSPTAWDGKLRLSDLPSLEAAGWIKAAAKSKALSYVDDLSKKTYKVTWSCGLPGIDNAVRIYRGESPDSVLNGHKVRSFYNNILGGSDSGGSVTVDTHALSAAVGEKVPAQDKRMAVLQSPTNRQYSVKGAYSIFADAYRRVAAAHGISPEQAQAMIWIEWRKTHP